MTFTPTDTTDYNTVTGTAITVTVSKATPTITTPPTASAISVGQTLLASTLAGGTASYNSTPVPGTFAWTTPATIPPAGADPESVTFTPTDTTDYNTVTTTVTVTVNNKTTPTITTLPTASAITYGQTLASSTLTGGTSFRCRHVRLDHPDDSSRCGYAFRERNLHAHRYDRLQHGDRYCHGYGEQGHTDGNDLADSQHHLRRPDSGRVDADGRHGSSGAPFPARSPGPRRRQFRLWVRHPESVTFTPTDTTDYNTATATVTVTVNSKTTPTITTLPTASAITYGQTLASSMLTGGTASVAGTFAWTTPTTAPGAGTPSESVTFTPTDTTDYNTVTGTVTVTVSKATPTVTTLPTASAISVGQTLAASTLTGGTATSGGTPVPGTFAWTTPTTVPPVGTDPESVTFTPTDTTDYNTVTATVTVTVNNKTTPTITTLPTASAITYGQTLASSTLTGGTASSGSPFGTFAWTTPTTAPGAGTPSESVTFTPTDTTDYNTVTGTVTVTVNKATPTVTTLPTASAISVGQTLSASTLTGGTAPSALPFPARSPGPRRRQFPPAGADPESVTFTPTDTTDYNTVTATVTVTVNSKTTPTVTAWPTASAIYLRPDSGLVGADGRHGFRCRHVRLDHADDSFPLRVRMRRA